MIGWVNMRKSGSVPMRVKFLETKVLVRTQKCGVREYAYVQFFKLSKCAYLHHSFDIYKFYILPLSAYALCLTERRKQNQ